VRPCGESDRLKVFLKTGEGRIQDTSWEGKKRSPAHQYRGVQKASKIDFGEKILDKQRKRIHARITPRTCVVLERTHSGTDRGKILKKRRTVRQLSLQSAKLRQFAGKAAIGSVDQDE